MFLSWLARNCWAVEFISACNKTPISPLCLGLWLVCALQKGGRKATLWNCSEHLSRLNSILDTNVKERLPWLLLLVYWGAMWCSIERHADNDTEQGAGREGSGGENDLPEQTGKASASSSVHAGTGARIRELPSLAANMLCGPFPQLRLDLPGS